jgi:glutathione S-transferase
MKLYNDKAAPNPRRVRIFLAEKGVEIPTVDINIMEEEHRSEAFTRLNPLQRLPVLELDDGTVLAETVAICRYVEELHPEPALMGVDPLDRARVEMWQRHIEMHLFSPIAQCMRHLHPRLAILEKPQVKEWGEANRGKSQEAFAWLDRELAGRRFVAGDRFTIADITALCAADFARFARIEVPAEMTSYHRWYEEVSARPSASA